MRLIELGNYRPLKNSWEENTLCRGMLGHESLRIGRKTAFDNGFVPFNRPTFGDGLFFSLLIFFPFSADQFQ
jgi:hypothetical protein